MTIGVLNRVEQLADSSPVSLKKGRVPFKNLIPLDEIIAEAFNVGSKSKKVAGMYEKLISNLGNEFDVLLDVPVNKISDVGSSIIAEAIKRVRAGKINIKPGYDGEYGEIFIFSEKEKKK